MLGLETKEIRKEAWRDLVDPKRITPLTTGMSLPRSTEGLCAQVRGTATSFLLKQTGIGVFPNPEPSKAFFVGISDPAGSGVSCCRGCQRRRALITKRVSYSFPSFIWKPSGTRRASARKAGSS